MQARKLSRQQARPFCLSLHIRHPSLEPAQISRELECEPDEAFGAGEPRKSRGGAGAAGVHCETYWVARLDPGLWRPPFSRKTRAASAASSATGTLDAIESIRARTHSALAELTPKEARVFRMRFRIDSGPRSERQQPVDRLARIEQLMALAREQGEPAEPLSEALHLLCFRFALRHAAFFKRLREEGGSVRLLVTLSPEAVRGLTILPQVSERLGELGIHLELVFAGASAAPEEA